MNLILRNNTGNKGKEELINGFVIRTKPFKAIYQEIANSASDKPEQHYLVIGQRGTGKTTLLYRLKYAFEDNLPKNMRIIPLMFNEEQYNLSELADLWENIASLLEEAGYFDGLRNSMEAHHQKKIYEEIAFDILESCLKKENRKIIVFFENIDSFFRKIGTPGQKRLREVLTSSHYLRLIATSTTYFQDITDYTKPFYDFFKIIELKGLTNRESVELLLRIGEEHDQKEIIENIIRKEPKRIESLRRLTGGVPRTISYLFQIFLDNENGKAIKDLYQLIDTLTFLYKAELDQLSTQQQKVVDVIAKNWDAVGVKDIAARTRYESKQVSSILQVLEKNQLVELVRTGSKNNLYRIRERFMNIWYLMRFGRKQERENVIWLVRFYDAWCDRKELTKHIVKHIKNLRDGNYDLNAALDMANTFLACENVSEDLKYNIYRTTKDILPREQVKALKYFCKDIYDRVNKLIKEKKNDQAVELLNELGARDERYYDFASFVYSRIKDYEKAEEMAEIYYTLTPDRPRAALRVAVFNDRHLNNKEKAIQYYKIALDKKEYKAAAYLGEIYVKEENWELAKEYLQIAEKHKIISSYMSLATVYFFGDNFEKAEEYCFKAINAGNDSALLNLGLLHERKGELEKAISFFEQALAKGFHFANLWLGRIAMTKPIPDFASAEKYLTEAYNQKIETAGFHLGQLYLENLGDEKEGIKLLNEEVKKGNANAAHMLAHYYDDHDDLKKSDALFLESFRLGRTTAIFCYTNSLFWKGRTEEKQKALDVLEKSLPFIEKSGPPAHLEYAFVLLWNDQIEKSLTLVLEQITEIKLVFESEDEDKIEEILINLTEYLILLIAKGQYKAAATFFTQDKVKFDFKQALKPIYYALMNYMKKEYPKEYLKAGNELKDTVEEVLKTIDSFKKRL